MHNESATIFFLRGFSAASGAYDGADREFLSQSHFDVAGLDPGSHSSVSRGD